MLHLSKHAVFRQLLIFFFSVATPAVQAVCLPGLSSAADFIENCGRADPRSAELRQAKAVFKKLRRVATIPRKYEARLLVTDKPAGLMAVAVPDAIVVSLETVHFCYRGVSARDGDTRLAFVLGHELAHQANKDMRNRHASLLVEPNADEDGFLYAAVAGYPVDRLAESGQAFFAAWYQSQTGGMTDASHGTPGERAARLQGKLKKLLEEIIFFRFGTRLAHFGRYEDAAYFLARFREYFASPETLNNLGYVRLQLALKKGLDNSGGYAADRVDDLPYCLPAMLDVHTRAELLGIASTGGLRGMDETVGDLLRKAQADFKEATELDPAYVPGWQNRAVTAFYLQEYSKAKWLADEAALPGNAFAQTLIALIALAQGGDIDTWPNALGILQPLADKPEAAACDVYNTALLLSRRGRAEARVYWQKLLGQALLPEPLRAIVCERESCPVAEREAEPPWRMPVEPGALLTPLPPHLKSWASFPFNFNRKVRGAIYQAPDGSAELLAFSGENGAYADMLVLKSGLNTTLEQAARYCRGPMQRRESTGNVVLRSCAGWTMLVKDGRISEVWAVESE
ncbi:MAG: hypothetical protein GY862_39495 [Gammaproteobacteria bacterium]|nr:hypothetical protein [Gammaproteobacteria bacterium]